MKVSKSFGQYFKLQVKQCIMIFLTNFISGICLPSLVVYMPLVFKRYKHCEANIDIGITWASMVNIGLFFVFNSFGSLINVYKKVKKDISISLCILMVSVELACSCYIVGFTYSQDNRNDLALYGKAAISMLGLIHGYLSSYFMNYQQPKEKIFMTE